jgi:hypothetical protein
MTTPEAEPRLRTDSNFSINVNHELAKLRKIEAAARAHVAWEYRDRGAVRFTLSALRAALDEESQP